MTDDTRRAPATWSLLDQQGEHEAVVGDGTLTVGPATISLLDADDYHAADYHIVIGLWPKGELRLSQLGRRFDAFAHALGSERNRTRVAGLLAHAPEAPEAFTGAVLGGKTPRPAELLVYGTHVTVVPEGADPYQVPLGAIDRVATSDDPPSVALGRPGSAVVIGQLARRRDEFRGAVSEAKRAQDQVLSDYTGQSGFSDGQGVAKSTVRDFDGLLARCAAAERLDGARRLLALASAEPKLGFVQLLDPDDSGTKAATPLPGEWASFLLVPANRSVVLEILAGPSAATYVFEGDIDGINRDLQLLHFRRGALALGEAQAQVTPDNPHRLALRRLEPLLRLRKATRGRLVHNDGWNAALAAALT